MTNKFVPRNILKKDNNLPKSLVGLIPKGQVLNYRATVIEITKTNFLKLVSNHNLIYPAIYKIIDISGFSSIYVNTLSTSMFSTNASGNLFYPNYEISGVNLGQLNANDIQTVADGEMVIWGDHYWVNNSGSPVTPTIIDDYILDAPLEQLVKSIDNGYSQALVNLVVDNTLQIYKIEVPLNSNKWIAASVTTTSDSPWIYYPLSMGSYIDSITVMNCIDTNGNLTLIKNDSGDSSQFKENIGKIQNITFLGNRCEFTNNQVAEDGAIQGIQLYYTSRFNQNIVSGSVAELGDCIIGFIELFDDCEMVGNQVTGDGANIYDIRTGEGSSINNNICSGRNAEFGEFDMMVLDHIDRNELSGDNTQLAGIHTKGFSEVCDNTLSGDNTVIKAVELIYSKLNNFTLSSDNKEIKHLFLRNCQLTNGNDIQLQNCNFSEVNINLTGFAVDIIGESIEAGKGWFTITHDFNTNPLASGSSFEYNLIPLGGRITNIQAIGLISGGAGATLTIGLQTDDESLISDTVGNYSTGQSYSGFSGQATANRSLKLKAGVNTINSGTITVKVEFIL